MLESQDGSWNSSVSAAGGSCLSFLVWALCCRDRTCLCGSLRLAKGTQGYCVCFRQLPGNPDFKSAAPSQECHLLLQESDGDNRKSRLAAPELSAWLPLSFLPGCVVSPLAPAPAPCQSSLLNSRLKSPFLLKHPTSNIHNAKGQQFLLFSGHGQQVYGSGAYRKGPVESSCDPQDDQETRKKEGVGRKRNPSRPCLPTPRVQFPA